MMSRCWNLFPAKKALNLHSIELAPHCQNKRSWFCCARTTHRKHLLCLFFSQLRYFLVKFFWRGAWAHQVFCTPPIPKHAANHWTQLFWGWSAQKVGLPKSIVSAHIARSVSLECSSWPIFSSSLHLSHKSVKKNKSCYQCLTQYCHQYIQYGLYSAWMNTNVLHGIPSMDRRLWIAAEVFCKITCNCHQKLGLQPEWFFLFCRGCFISVACL